MSNTNYNKLLITTLTAGFLVFVFGGTSSAQGILPESAKVPEQAQKDSKNKEDEVSESAIEDSAEPSSIEAPAEDLTQEQLIDFFQQLNETSEEPTGVILQSPSDPEEDLFFDETVDAIEPVDRTFYELPDPEPSRIRFRLPSPRSFFELLSPIPAPIIEIIDQFNDILVDPVCPAPVIDAPNCSLGLVDVTNPANDYQLIWRCGGTFRPCTLHANDEVVGHLRGAGLANLNMGSERTIIYELKGRDGELCGTRIAHSFRINTVPATPNTTLVQSSYRIFSNANSVTPGSALAAENTQATITSTQAFRLRMLIHVDGADLAKSGANLKLQKAEKGTDCPSSTWSDVTGAGDIIYNNNATPADGDAIAAISGDPTRGSEDVGPQSYQEANNFSNTGGAIPVGASGLWDFSLSGNVGFGTPTFCFRAVHSDGSVLSSYEQYPEVFCTGGKGGCF